MKTFCVYDETINSVVWIVTETYDNGELVMTRKIRKDVYEAELAAPRKLKVGDRIKFSNSGWETSYFIHRIEPYDGRYKEKFDRVIYYHNSHQGWQQGALKA